MKNSSTHHHKKAPPASGSKTGNTLLKSSVFGAVVSLCALVIMILLSSALCLLFDDPHRFVVPLCFFSLYTSSFIGGLASVKRNGSGALLCGALTGALLMIVFWVIFAATDAVWQSNTSGILPFILKLSVIPVSVIGALIGTGSGKPRHKRPKNF